MMGMMSQMNPDQMARMVESCNRMMAGIDVQERDSQRPSAAH
jgi:hypothetical protein